MRFIHESCTSSYIYTCSSCGAKCYQVTGNCGRKIKVAHPKCTYKFCPNCGEKNEETEQVEHCKGCKWIRVLDDGKMVCWVPFKRGGDVHTVGIIHADDKRCSEWEEE